MSILTKVLKWFTNDDEEKKKKSVPKKKEEKKKALPQKTETKTKSLPKKQEKKEVYGPPVAKKENNLPKKTETKPLPKKQEKKEVYGPPVANKTEPKKNNTYNLKSYEELVNPVKTRTFMKQEDWKNPQKVQEYFETLPKPKKWNEKLNRKDYLQGDDKADVVNKFIGSYGADKLSDDIDNLNMYSDVYDLAKKVNNLRVQIKSDNFRGVNNPENVINLYIYETALREKANKDHSFENEKSIFEELGIREQEKPRDYVEYYVDAYRQSLDDNGKKDSTVRKFADRRKSDEEQAEKQRAYKENMLKFENVASKYGIKAEDFTSDDFKNWREQNGVEAVSYVTDTGRARIMYVSKNKDAEKDAAVLSELAGQNDKEKMVEQKLGVAESATVGFLDGVAGWLNDANEKLEFSAAGLNPKAFVTTSEVFREQASEHPVAYTTGQIGGNLAVTLPASYAVGGLFGMSSTFASMPTWAQEAIKDFITLSSTSGLKTTVQTGSLKEGAKAAFRDGLSAMGGGAASGGTASLLDDFFANPNLVNNTWNTMLKRSAPFIVGASDMAGEGITDAAYAGITGQEQRTGLDWLADGGTIFAFKLIESALGNKGVKNIETGKQKADAFIDSYTAYRENPTAETAKQLIKDGNSLKRAIDKMGVDKETSSAVKNMINFVGDVASGKTEAKNLPTTETVTPSLPTKKVTPVSTEGGKLPNMPVVSKEGISFVINKRIPDGLTETIATVKQRSGLDVMVGKRYENGQLDTSFRGVFDGQKIIVSENATKTDIFNEVIMHELTHGIEGTKLYSDISDYVIKQMFGEDTNKLNTAINEKIEAYKGKQDLTPDSARAELVADGIKKYVFADDVNSIVSSDYTLGQKIYDYITEILYRLNKKFGDLYNFDELKTAQRKYRMALDEVKSGGMTLDSNSYKNYNELNSSYLFVGEKSSLANKSLLTIAKERFKNGENPESIFKDTGWFKGKDNKWRYEIDDSKMLFDKKGFINNPDLLRLNELESKFIDTTITQDEYNELKVLINATKGTRKSSKLSDYVRYDELFNSYPQLKTVNVKMVANLPKNENGHYNPSTNTIAIKSTLNDAKAKEIMVHEIQHVVQHIEKFETGSNLKEALDLVRDKAREYLVKNGELNKVPISEIDQYVDDFLRKEYHTKDINDIAYKAYRSLYGEKEARKAQERVNMDGVERRNTYPEYSERSWTKDEYGQTNMVGNSKQNDFANSANIYEVEKQIQKEKSNQKVRDLEQGLNVEQYSFASQNDIESEIGTGYTMDNAEYSRLLNERAMSRAEGERFADETYRRFGKQDGGSRTETAATRVIAPVYEGIDADTINNTTNILVGNEQALYQTRKEMRKIKEALKPTEKQLAYIDKIAKGEAEITDFSPDLKLDDFQDLINIKKEIAALENNGIKGFRERSRASFRDKIAGLVERSETWKDKFTKLQWDINPAERNAYDTMGEDANEFIDTFIAPAKANGANLKRYVAELKQKIIDLNLTNKEFEAVQKYGEGLIRNASDKVVQAHKVFSEIAEQIKNDVNATLVLNGYKPIDNPKLHLDAFEFKQALKVLNGEADYESINSGKIRQFINIAQRNGIDSVNYDTRGKVTGTVSIPYYPHGQNLTTLQKVKKAMGFSQEVTELPGEITGVTSEFKPNKKWVPNFLQRKGKNTDYSLTNWDNYIDNIAEVIFHTGDITKLRIFEAALRNKYSPAELDAEVRAAIDNMTNEELSEYLPTLNEKRNELSKHNNLINWINEYANQLAGKKHSLDRGFEGEIGRRFYNLMDTVSNNWTLNQIAFNASSWFNQFKQATNIISENNPIDVITAIGSNFFDKTPLKESDFIVTREGNLRLKESAISKIAFAVPQNIDRAMTSWAYRTKYNEVIRKGGTEAEAKKAADIYAGQVMGDRSKVGRPTIFGARNPIVRLFTTFQLENINSWQHLLKDIPREKGWAIAFKTAIAMTIANALFNEGKEEITGTQGIGFDPYEMAVETFKYFAKEEGVDIDSVKETYIENLSRLPFAQTALVFTGMEDVDRLPVVGTFKNMGNGRPEDVISFLNPFGGYNQARKTIQGIGAVAKGGVYDNNGNLQYPIEQNAENYIKGALFGKYSLPESREYWDNNRRALTEDETKEYNYRVEQGENPQDVYNEIYGRKEVRKEKSLTNEEYKKAVEEMVTEFDYGTSLELNNLYNQYKGTNSKATSIGVPTASRNFSYNGEDYELTTEQCAELQNRYNEAYATGIDGILDDASLSTKEKYDKVSQIRKDVKASVLSSFMKEQFDATGFNEDDEEEYRYRINKGENADAVYNEIVNRNDVKKQASKENKEYRNKADKLTTAFDEDAEYALDALYEAYKATNKDATKIDVPKAGKVLTVNGVDIELTPEQNAELQNRFNTEYYNGIAGVLNDDSLTEGQKYNKIKTIRSGVQKRVKTQFFNELRSGNVQQSAPVNDSGTKTFEELFMGASSSGTTQQSTPQNTPQNAEQTKTFEELFMGAKPSNSGVTFHQGVKITNYNDGKHKGMDFAVNTGTPIQSTVDGEVVTAKKIPNSYGTHVVIKDANGNHHYFAHLSSFNVRVGDKVTRGQNIGKSGDTGNSTGPHLHYEVRVGNDYSNQIDPRNYL